MKEIRIIAACCAVAVFGIGCKNQSTASNQPSPAKVNPSDSASSASTAGTTGAPTPSSGPKEPSPTPGSNPPGANSGPKEGAPKQPLLGIQEKFHPEPIEKPGQGGWGKSDLTAEQIGSEIDSGLKTLSNAFGDIRVQVVLQAAHGAGKGEALNVAQIGSGNRFHVEYVGLETGEIRRHYIRSDGKSFIQSFTEVPKGQEGRPDPQSLSARKGLSGATLVKSWPSEMPEFALGYYTTGHPIYAPLIRALSSGLGHYKLVAEKRTMTLQGQLLTDYRIVATRDPKWQAKMGMSQIEIVADGGKFLPLTLRVRSGKSKFKETELDWAAQWKPFKFTPSIFSL